MLEHAFSQEAFKPTVLFLKLLQALDVIDRHAAIGLAPAVKGVFCDAIVTTDRRDGLFARQCLVKNRDDLFGGVMIELHENPPVERILTYHLV